MWWLTLSAISGVILCGTILSARKHWKSARKDSAVASNAFRHACITSEVRVAPLVRELERIHRENNLAPRIQDAFRLHHHHEGST